MHRVYVGTEVQIKKNKMIPWDMVKKAIELEIRWCFEDKSEIIYCNSQRKPH